MDLNKERAVCGTCKEWQGKRERCEEGKLVRVSATIKGNCRRLAKLKAPQGGCDKWMKWEEE